MEQTKSLVLNIRRGKKIILFAITEQQHNMLKEYAKGDKVIRERLYKKVNTKLKENFQIEIKDLVLVAGDEQHGVRLDNGDIKQFVPATTINGIPSYYCYSGNDYRIKYANTIMHEDSSASASCALARIGNPKFIMICSCVTKEADWEIHRESTLNIKEYVKLNRAKALPQKSKQAS